MAKDKDQDTQQMPAIPVVSTTSAFADKVEDLMNHAVQQSIPAQGDQATEHHQKFARWANALGDLWREVKGHAR